MTTPASALPSVPQSVARRRPAGDVAPIVAQALALAEAAQIRAVSLSFSGFGDLELPDAPTSEDEAALIRAVATLYLAAELEVAGLIRAVETLAALTIESGLNVETGPATVAISSFWRERRDRFTREERSGVFARLFGSVGMEGPGPAGQGVNPAFEEHMISLCEAIYRLEEEARGRERPTLRGEIGLRTAGRALAENLLSHGGGMTAFAAREIAGTLSQAVAILKLPAVQASVGARSVWGAVAAVARRYSGEQADTASHVARGKAGLTVISWLADVLPFLGDSSRPLLRLDDPVIPAALEWLEESLSVQEARYAALAGGARSVADSRG